MADNNHIIDINYRQWDYDSPHDTLNQLRLSAFIRQMTHAQGNEWMQWMGQEQPKFLFSHKSFIFCVLIKTRHFEGCNALLEQVGFNAAMAQDCFYSLMVDFDTSKLDYWAQKLSELSPNQVHEVQRNFWYEFFSCQFVNSSEFEAHLPQLKPVFEAVDFYHDTSEMMNKYLVEFRQPYWTGQIHSLNPSHQQILVEQVARACARNQPHARALFAEEFKAYPFGVAMFDKALLNQNLHESLAQGQASSHRMKI